MHDFAATRTHTILLNLPLTLSPANLFSVPPVPLIHFDRTLPSEFVIFPRLEDNPVRYIESEPSLIFHTANAWDEPGAINMLSCRFKSAKLVYAAGAVDVPAVEKVAGEDDVVRLHYHRFAVDKPIITHSFPLSVIPFEFPSLPTDLAMSAARYVYGCTMKSGSFDERLGGAAKVDCLVKVNVLDLIAKGRARGNGKNMEPVDPRSTLEIMADWNAGKKGPLEIFAMPPGWYAQEPRFVPRSGDEDDGYLLTYGWFNKISLT
jgi:carotenoid cleavage dioxygenase-like enzyme